MGFFDSLKGAFQVADVSDQNFFINLRTQSTSPEDYTKRIQKMFAQLEATQIIDREKGRTPNPKTQSDIDVLKLELSKNDQSEH